MKELAHYSVPLKNCDVTIVIKGKKLSVDDFDALIEAVELFKKNGSQRPFSDQVKLQEIPSI